MLRALKKLLPISVLLLLPAQAIAADDPNLFNWLNDPTGSALYFLTNFLASIGGKLILLTAFLVNIAFRFTFNVVNSPAVSQGFQITLTLANLGFVIGIIVIAIATIFRSQTYGVKRLLTSLVAMAILVNFGLIISGVFINFSDQLTTYFLNAVGGGAQDPSLWIQTMVQSVSPQGLLYDPQSGGSWWDKYTNTSLNTDNVGDSMQQLFALVFVILFTFLFVLALGVVGVMLFLRYFWLTFLLILLPLAWLSWVFPALKKHWSDWWQHFIKWTFFAPVLMFFLYLAVSVGSISNESYLQNTLTPVAKDQLTSQLAGNLGRKPGFLGALAKEVIVLGLIFGGLMAANKMGISMAGAAINGAKSTGKWIQGATKRGTRRAGTRVLGGEGVGKFSKGIQEFGAKYHIAPLRGIGQGIDALRAQSRGVVGDYEKMAAAKNGEQIVNQIGAKRGAELVGYLKAAQSKGVLNQAVAAITKASPEAINKDIFQNAGEMKFFGELNSLSGLAYKDYAKRRATPEEDLDKLDKAARDSIKALAGDKAVGFFAPFNPGKPVLGMSDEAEYRNFQKEIARDMLKFGTPSKIQKFWEEAGDDQVAEFKKAAQDNNLRETDINPQLLKWLRSGKGQEMFDASDFGIKTVSTSGAEKTTTEEDKRKAEATIQAS